ncbi:hypothetical protein [Streptococcus sp. zg-JUN1979]|uniref:hypothetical protein n=1 Tax=Streptococcus sp. zg-JUN1979 TaxID=3391450 RepID=UPI0039AF8234
MGTAFVNLVTSRFPNIKITASVRQERKKAKLLEMGFTDVVIEKDGLLQTKAQFDKIFELVGPATLADSILSII